MDKKTYIILVVIAVIILVGVYSIYSNKNKEKDEYYKISIEEWPAWKPMIDANGGLKTKEGSLYDKMGLKIEFVIMPDQSASSSAIIKGDTIGGTYTVPRLAFLQDKFDSANTDVVIPYISNYSNGSDGVVSKFEINSMRDLIGKKVAISKYTDAGIVFEWFLHNTGLTKEEQKKIHDDAVYIEDPETAAKACYSGEVDAATTWEPLMTQSDMSKNYKVLYSTAMHTEILLNGVVFRKDFADNSPEWMKKFIIGNLIMGKQYKGDLQYIRELPLCAEMSDEEIIDILNTAGFPTLEENRSLLVSGAIQSYKDACEIWADLNEVVHPNKAEVNFTDEFLPTDAEVEKWQ